MKKWLWVLVIGGLILGAFGYGYYLPHGQGKHSIEVKEGMSSKDIADSLSRVTGLQSEILLTAQALAGKEVIHQGKYSLNLPANSFDIWKQMYQQSRIIIEERKKSGTREVLKVVIPEGKSADEIVGLLEKAKYKNANKLADVWKKYSEELFNEYTFLPEKRDCEYGNVHECVKYYVEGFLFPATYEVYIDEDPLLLTYKFLNAFAKNNPTLLKESRQKIYDRVILASVIEKETGRPGGNLQDPILQQERKLVAGVFQNRNELGMRWQSDPTVEYGTSTKLCQSGRTITDCKALNDPLYKNSLYNTYVQKVPIGPIANPSQASLDAAQNPTENDYLYFVADITGKKYFAKTAGGHEANIQKIIAINKEVENN